MCGVCVVFYVLVVRLALACVFGSFGWRPSFVQSGRSFMYSVERGLVL